MNFNFDGIDLHDAVLGEDGQEALDIIGLGEIQISDANAVAVKEHYFTCLINEVVVGLVTLFPNDE